MFYFFSQDFGDIACIFQNFYFKYGRNFGCQVAAPYGRDAFRVKTAKHMWWDRDANYYSPLQQDLIYFHCGSLLIIDVHKCCRSILFLSHIFLRFLRLLLIVFLFGCTFWFSVWVISIVCDLGISMLFVPSKLDNLFHNYIKKRKSNFPLASSCKIVRMASLPLFGILYREFKLQIFPIIICKKEWIILWAGSAASNIQKAIRIFYNQRHADGQTFWHIGCVRHFRHSNEIFQMTFSTIRMCQNAYSSAWRSLEYSDSFLNIWGCRTRPENNSFFFTNYDGRNL